VSRVATDRAAKQRPAQAMEVVDFTGWQRRAVISSLSRLAAAGLIIDTHDRIGRTRQVKVWRFPFDRERVQERHPLPVRKSASTSTLSDAERVHLVHPEP
jgi:pyocin large subunit-like protein